MAPGDVLTPTPVRETAPALRKPGPTAAPATLSQSVPQGQGQLAPAKYCWQCGAPVANYRFCQQCGQQVSGPSAGGYRFGPDGSTYPRMSASVALAGIGGVLIGLSAMVPWVTFPVIERTAFTWDWGASGTGVILVVSAVLIIGTAILYWQRPDMTMVFRVVTGLAGGGAAAASGLALMTIIDGVQVPVEYMFRVEEYNRIFNSLGGGNVSVGAFLAVGGSAFAVVGALLRPMSK